MRVTLRTLIAGQCGLLNPQQQALLDEQLRQHVAARSLYEHLGMLHQSATPRTPPLSGTGLGIDPASVAGYLQRQLPPDQAQAFERLAIESDQVLDELMGLASLSVAMNGRHGLSADRIERVLAIGMEGAQLDGEQGLEASGLQATAATTDRTDTITRKKIVPSVALATSGKSSYRRRGMLALLAITAAVALLVFPMGSRRFPERAAPGLEDSIAAETSRQSATRVEDHLHTASEPAVVAASWEAAHSDLQQPTSKKSELVSRADHLAAVGSTASLEVDRRIAAGDLSLVAGVGNLLGDPHQSESWHGWIDWVSHRCQEDPLWQDRLELEIAKRPGNWQPVLRLLWQGVPQAGSDPIWRRWLLDALVHEQLEIRVLASYQYAKLTGMVPPIFDRNHALQSVARWEERLMRSDPRP